MWREDRGAGAATAAGKSSSPPKSVNRITPGAWCLRGDAAGAAAGVGATARVIGRVGGNSVSGLAARAAAGAIADRDAR
ncbi:MAG: hypothetical protein ACLGH2_13295, partial [Gammaproteobacteria bacterium]